MANTDLVKKKPVALEVATYKRLSDLAAQLRIDNPGGGFVSMSTAVGVLLDRYEEATPKGMTLLELLEATKKLEGLDEVEIAALDVVIAEANKPVIIKQSDGAQYLEKMLAHNHNAYLTPQREKAMVFDSRDQSATFLRKCGHEVGNWIIEPA